jgi:uncharacterized phage-associated protein
MELWKNCDQEDMTVPINETKYRNAILFFVSHIDNGTLGKVKLMKLLYYLDFDHFQQYGASVTGDDYLRWEKGPVPASAETIIQNMVADGQLQVESIDIGLSRPQSKYIPLCSCDVQVFSPSEVAVLFEVAEKWAHHTGSDMVRAVHGEPPWLETAANAVIDYRLALKRPGKDCEPTEEEHMDERMSAEDRALRERGLRLVAQMEQLTQTDEGFRRWLQIGFDQEEAGQVIAVGEDGWEEE